MEIEIKMENDKTKLKDKEKIEDLRNQLKYVSKLIKEIREISG